MADRLARLAALDRARAFVGVKEHPYGSNKGPQIEKWQKRVNGLTGYPWCAAFLWCMFDDVGKRLTIPGPALVENWDRWADQNGRLVSRPLKGDVICYDWNRDNWSDHIGIVDKVLALRWKGKVFVGCVRAIEGNTSAGNDSNGGQVQVRTRWLNDKTKFVRIPGTVPAL